MLNEQPSGHHERGQDVGRGTCPKPQFDIQTKQKNRDAQNLRIIHTGAPVADCHIAEKRQAACHRRQTVPHGGRQNKHDQRNDADHCGGGQRTPGKYGIRNDMHHPGHHDERERRIVVPNQRR